MALPQEKIDQIKKDAEKLAWRWWDDPLNKECIRQRNYATEIYINAATTEAERAQAEMFVERKAMQERLLAIEAKAQKLADALEFIKTYGPDQTELTQKFIAKTLSQWNEGKEVEG